jgi:hypothetical protein
MKGQFSWTEHNRDPGVAEDHVRLEVQLPWLLSMLANKAKALVEAGQAHAGKAGQADEAKLTVCSRASLTRHPSI